MVEEYIDIRGAREHNLKNIELKLPKDKLIVFTGVSGSGKSSLAFDTIYTEGQRRYIESLSAYARQFLGQLEKPDVDFIGGLSPSISIDQKSAGHNPRSTVATITDIYDYLRVLFARVGTQHCTECGRPVGMQTAEAIVNQIVGLPERTRILILAPIVSGRRGEYRDELEDARKAGFIRARIDGQVYDLMEDIHLDRNQRHDIEIVVDRLTIKEDILSRATEAVETALSMGGGRLIVNIVEGQPNAGDLLFSKDYTCVHCNISYEPLAPRNFSFNSPAGMCPTCKGLGTTTEMSPELVVPDPTKSIGAGAIALWGTLDKLQTYRIAYGITNYLGVTLDTPWKDLTDAQQHIILYGTGEEAIPLVYEAPWGHRFRFNTLYEGVIPPEERKYFQSTSEFHRRNLSKYMVTGPCSDCEGTRLRREIKAVTIAEKSILDLVSMPVGDCLEFFQKLHLREREAFIAEELLKEIKGRLGFLISVGLDYLTLDRTAPTLSGGESQRIRLASQVGAGLRGVVYVLDEPSIGLHPRDNAHLLATLKHLRDQGNTVIVVEHDEETMWAGDLIVDFGPGPGVKGGEISAMGPPQEVVKESDALTAQYLRGEQQIEIPSDRRLVGDRWLEICGARHNNLKNIDVRIPIGVFTGVTGVSGSGKSSLINDILHKQLGHELMKAETQPGDHDTIRFITVNGDADSVKESKIEQAVDKVIDIDQSPIGRTPRSNPATYTKVFDQIRALYAELPESKLRGYKPGRFSFNVKGGRCESCSGNGSKQIEMHFLADVWVKCNVCQGRRYNEETLQVKYKGKSITDVLEMDVQEALEHFENIPKIAAILQTLHDVGLDYIKLGQPAPTLSGGEAQRIKLSRELAKRSTGKTLYILDEPTTGLHFDDVKKLLAVLHRLVDSGNTVVVIEHNLEVIKTADYLIDLGPEGGEAGGYVVGLGTPEEMAAMDDSHTGMALMKVLAGKMRAEPDAPDTDLTLQETEDISQLDPPGAAKHIFVRGAREHNLKNIDVDIPHRQMTTFTGVSGSGKSSLAVDTIYAEGQRRYVESLSAYARQFLGQLEKPKVEKIEGLSPAIAIEQKAPSKNPRSTVGTVTEIHDYLRVLYARVGTPHCTECGTAVTPQTLQQIVDQLMGLPDRTRVYVLSPLVLKGAENYPDAFRRLQREGYARVEVNGEIYTIDDVPRIRKSIRHDVKIVIDRLALEPEVRGRLSEAIETALEQSNGVVVVNVVEGEDTTPFFFSEHSSCLSCSLSFPLLTPRHFSFNSQLGQCPACEGFGTVNVTNRACTECKGTRLQPFPSGVRLGGKTIAQATAMSIGEALQFFADLDLSPHEMEIARTLLEEVRNRLQFLIDVGLHYLTLDRPAPSLSGGEMQRIRLASQLGSGLTGVTYILDEPSIGLHQRDQERLLNALKNLRDLGNSVLVVEHDMDTMLTSDHIIDFGPNAGKLGGEIVTVGSPGEIQQHQTSLTGRYLNGTLKIDVPKQRRPGKGPSLEIVGAKTNNLKDIDVSIPLGTLTCVTGVSGSGKSSLIEETLAPMLAKSLNNILPNTPGQMKGRTGKCKWIYGIEYLDKVINIDQQPIGDTPRSNPATYTDVFTKIRHLYAELPEARTLGFDSRRFSFNLKVGQCESCAGHGYNRIEMHFLADVWVKCESCGGTGYNRETLQIKFKGKNIADVLAMTVKEALDHFNLVPTIRKSLQMLYDVGLDYIQLGQSSTTLSGGEAQRVKLASELAKRSTGRTIYMMDEPTTGLHFDDIQKLLVVLNRLVDKGNTIVIIEHNMDVIKSADWVIDLGPEGGEAGGELVAMGTPEQVAQEERSHTGRFLRKALAN